MSRAIVPMGAEASVVLAALHADAFTDGDVWSGQAIAELLAVPGTTALCLCDGTSPLGFVMMRVVADEGEILTIAVRQDARRSGAGRALIEAAVKAAAASGVKRLFLDVAENNEAARALYAATGFREVGCRCQYYADGADARVLMASLKEDI